MITSVKELLDSTIMGEDGKIGDCWDLLIDQRNWRLRYAVALSAKWLSRRKILISPSFLKDVKRESGVLQTSLTRKQVEGMPPLDADAPISMQYERKYHQYFKLPFYDTEGGIRGGILDYKEKSGGSDQAEPIQTHTRSLRKIIGYKIAARDGGAGTVGDFIIDGTAWMLRYAVIETPNGGAENNVLLPIDAIDQINWAVGELIVDRSAAEVKNGPADEPAAKPDK